MLHLREYATSAAYNADTTREYPTVSYVTGGDVYYEMPTIRLGESSDSNSYAVIESYDSEVITNWPNIRIDNTAMPTYTFAYNAQSNEFVYTNNGNTYKLSLNNGHVKSYFTNGNLQGYKTYNPDGSEYIPQLDGGIRE